MDTDIMFAEGRTVDRGLSASTLHKHKSAKDPSQPHTSFPWLKTRKIAEDVVLLMKAWDRMGLVRIAILFEKIVKKKSKKLALDEMENSGPLLRGYSKLQQDIEAKGLDQEAKGKWKAASKTWQRLLKVELKQLGHDHPFVLSTFRHLASCARQLGHDETEKKWGKKELEGLALAAAKMTKQNGVRAEGSDDDVGLRSVAPNTSNLTRDDIDMAESGLKRWLKMQQESPERANILYSLGECAHEDRRWKEAADLFGQCLEILQLKYGPEHVDVGYALHAQGVCLRKAGLLEDGEELLRRCLRNMENAELNPEDTAMVCTRFQLGVCAQHAGRLKEAEELLKSCLKIWEKNLGPEDVQVATALHELGVCVREAGRLDEAENLFKRSLEIIMAKLGPDDVQVATTLHELGVCVRDAGRLEEAEGLLRRCLDIKDAKLDPKDAQLAVTLFTLGVWVREADRLDEAEGLLRRCLRIEEANVGPLDVQVAYTLHHLGVCVRDAGRHEEAEGLLRRCLRIFESNSDPDGMQVAYTLHELGVCIRQQGRLEEAEELLRRCLGIKEAKSGPDDLQVAYTLHSLGVCVREAGRLEEAEELLRRCLGIKEAKLGPEDVGMTYTLYELGECTGEAGRPEEAVEFLRRCLKIEEAQPNPEYMQVADTLHDLGVFVRRAGRLEEAEELLRRCLGIKEAKLGPEDVDVAYTLHSLGLCLQKLTRLEGAENVLRRCLSIREASYSPMSVRVSLTLHDLSECVRQMGRLEEAEKLWRRCLAIVEANVASKGTNATKKRERQLGWLEKGKELLARYLTLEEAERGDNCPAADGMLQEIDVCLTEAFQLEETDGLLGLYPGTNGPPSDPAKEKVKSLGHLPGDGAAEIGGSGDPETAKDPPKLLIAGGEWEVLTEELKAGEVYESKEGGIRLRVQPDSLRGPGTGPIGPIKLHHSVQLLMSNGQDYVADTIVHCPADVSFKKPLLLDFLLDDPDIRTGEGALREVLETYQVLRKNENDPGWEPMEENNVQLVDDSGTTYLRASVHHFTWFSCCMMSDVQSGIEEWNHGDMMAVKVRNLSEKTLLVVVLPQSTTVVRDTRRAVNATVNIGGVIEGGGGTESENRTEFEIYPTSQAPRCTQIGPGAKKPRRVELREKDCSEHLFICTVEPSSSGSMQPIGPSSTGNVTPASEPDDTEFVRVSLYEVRSVRGGKGFNFYQTQVELGCMRDRIVNKNAEGVSLAQVAMYLAWPEQQPRRGPSQIISDGIQSAVSRVFGRTKDEK